MKKVGPKKIFQNFSTQVICNILFSSQGQHYIHIVNIAKNSKNMVGVTTFSLVFLRTAIICLRNTLFLRACLARTCLYRLLKISTKTLELLIQAVKVPLRVPLCYHASLRTMFNYYNGVSGEIFTLHLSNLS